MLRWYLLIDFIYFYRILEKFDKQLEHWLSKDPSKNTPGVKKTSRFIRKRNETRQD